MHATEKALEAFRYNARRLTTKAAAIGHENKIDPEEAAKACLWLAEEIEAEARQLEKTARQVLEEIRGRAQARLPGV